MTLELATVLPVTQVLQSHFAPVGDSLRVRRALPDAAVPSIGPWVFLDHFGPAPIKPGDRGVPPHPHAGIQTVTYLLEGCMAHRDSAGHEGVVGPGGAQWMTAGRGIVHAEQPLRDERGGSDMLHGLQLWTSLPRAKKLMPPGYQAIEAAQVAQRAHDGAVLRVIAGSLDGLHGPAHTEMPLLLAHLRLAPQAQWQAAVAPGFEVGVYVLQGAVQAGAQATAVALGQLARCEAPPEAALLRLRNAGDAPAQAIVLAGAPAEGPLVFHGPFVMNSVEQVRYAERAYMTGAMGTLAA
jgi:redox-sensitive bicupin YhaK (pirin superfamily)